MIGHNYDKIDFIFISLITLYLVVLLILVLFLLMRPSSKDEIKNEYKTKKISTTKTDKLKLPTFVLPKLTMPVWFAKFIELLKEPIIKKVPVTELKNYKDNIKVKSHVAIQNNETEEIVENKADKNTDKISVSKTTKNKSTSTKKKASEVKKKNTTAKAKSTKGKEVNTKTKDSAKTISTKGKDTKAKNTKTTTASKKKVSSTELTKKKASTNNTTKKKNTRKKTPKSYGKSKKKK